MRLPKKIPRGATLRLELVQCGRCPKRNSQDLWIGVSRDLLITTL